MLSLILPLLERVGLIILVANLLMNSNFYKKIMYKREAKSSMIVFIITFGLFAIVSNFTGVVVSNGEMAQPSLLLEISPYAVIANTRSLTIGISGVIGGPIVGIFVGFISGTVRMFQGGVAPYTYFISSLLIGFISGIIGKRARNRKTFLTIWQGVILGIFLEMVQMICIYIFYPSQQEALALLQIISLPMIMMNSLGMGIFLSIISSTLKQEESMKAIQTHDVLGLANETLPFFRKGLNTDSCREAAKLIQYFTKVAAVSITDSKRILAHIGMGSDHHSAPLEIITDLTKRALTSKSILIAMDKEEIGCPNPNCPLKAAIVIPLFIKKRVIGTLKLYFDDPSKLTHVEEQLAQGLGNIFSSQLELGEMEGQQKLLKDMEIKALQSQVNPHFFFNAINTISALIRIDSEKARDLLLQLSHYFRFNLQGVCNELISIEDELTHLNAYLSIEKARFPNRYNITCHVDEVVKGAFVPPFIIQVLVENAIKHAFKDRKENNDVTINIHQIGEKIQLTVSDNGYGIDLEKIDAIGKVVVPSTSGTGSALENLNKRLISLFGEEAQLQFTTSEFGTTFTFLLPFVTKVEEDN